MMDFKDVLKQKKREEDKKPVYADIDVGPLSSKTSGRLAGSRDEAEEKKETYRPSVPEREERQNYRMSQTDTSDFSEHTRNTGMMLKKTLEAYKKDPSQKRKNQVLELRDAYKASKSRGK